MDKALLIRSNETEAYKQLGYWNLDKVSNLKDLKYIFVHNGAGAVTGAYELVYEKNGFRTDKPYQRSKLAVELHQFPRKARSIHRNQVRSFGNSQGSSGV